MHAFAVGRLCHLLSTPGQQTDGRTVVVLVVGFPLLSLPRTYHTWLMKTVQRAWTGEQSTFQLPCRRRPLYLREDSLLGVSGHDKCPVWEFIWRPYEESHKNSLGTGPPPPPPCRRRTTTAAAATVAKGRRRRRPPFSCGGRRQLRSDDIPPGRPTPIEGCLHPRTRSQRR